MEGHLWQEASEVRNKGGSKGGKRERDKCVRIEHDEKGDCPVMKHVSSS